MPPRWILFAGFPALLVACGGEPSSPSAEVPKLEHRFESTGVSEIQSVTSAPDGAVVISGYFRGKLELGTRTLESAGAADGFVAELETTGKVRWLRTVSGVGEGSAAATVVAPDGTIYVTGLAGGVTNLFGSEFDIAANNAAYLASLGPDGDLRWAKTIGESGFQAGVALALDDTGGVFVMGDFTGTIAFGADRYSAVSEQDAFVAAFTPDGEPRWSRVLSGTGTQATQKIAATNAGVFALSYTTGDVAVDGQEIAAGNGYYQPLVLTQLDPSGAHLWTRVLTGAAEEHQTHDHHLERSRSLVVASDGSVDVAYSLEHGLSHSGLEIPNPPEVELVHLSSEGVAQWSQSLGLVSGFQDNAGAFSVDGELRVAGSFYGSMFLGSHVVQAETRSAFVMAPGNFENPGFVFGDPATSLVITTTSRGAAGETLLGGFWRPAQTSEMHPLLLTFPAPEASVAVSAPL